MTRFYTTVFLVFGLITICNAQFGIRGQITRASVIQDQPADATGFDAGVHYWLRLKNYRVEFFPEVNFASLSSSVISQTRYGAAIPVSIYPLEFRGDCNCPTFSKQNDLLKKGLFLQIVPAWSINNLEVNNQNLISGYHDIDLGFGAGLDIGINDLLTITPLAHYFSNLFTSHESDLGGWRSDFRFGLRLGFRPDY